jgi:hypothetical protein
MLSLRTCLAPLLLAFATATVAAEGPLPPSSDKLERHQYAEPTRAEKLETCMLLWEEANHITRKRWRELCKEREEAK